MGILIVGLVLMCLVSTTIIWVVAVRSYRTSRSKGISIFVRNVIGILIIGFIVCICYNVGCHIMHDKIYYGTQRPLAMACHEYNAINGNLPYWKDAMDCLSVSDPEAGERLVERFINKDTAQPVNSAGVSTISVPPSSAFGSSR